MPVSPTQDWYHLGGFWQTTGIVAGAVLAVLNVWSRVRRGWKERDRARHEAQEKHDNKVRADQLADQLAQKAEEARKALHDDVDGLKGKMDGLHTAINGVQTTVQGISDASAKMVSEFKAHCDEDAKKFEVIGRQLNAQDAVLMDIPQIAKDVRAMKVTRASASKGKI